MNDNTYINPWYQLYYKYKGISYSNAEDDRKFKAWTGVAPSVAEYIFKKYYDQVFLSSRTSLLILLHYLKNAPTEDEGSAEFLIKSRTTYRMHLMNALSYLDDAMDEIKLEDRLLF
jgi:hypothetical protein